MREQLSGLGQRVRLKSGGPVMTVENYDVYPLSAGAQIPVHLVRRQERGEVWSVQAGDA
jgi:hypothetical protein